MDVMHSDLFLMHHVDRISSSQLLGFKDRVFESSHGQSAATLVSYCPSRSSELEETATTKHSDRLAEIRCTGFLSEIGTKLRDWAVGQAGSGC